MKKKIVLMDLAQHDTPFGKALSLQRRSRQRHNSATRYRNRYKSAPMSSGFSLSLEPTRDRIFPARQSPALGHWTSYWHCGMVDNDKTKVISDRLRLNSFQFVSKRSLIFSMHSIKAAAKNWKARISDVNSCQTIIERLLKLRLLWNVERRNAAIT